MDLLMFVIWPWMPKTEKPMNIMIGSERNVARWLHCICTTSEFYPIYLDWFDESSWVSFIEVLCFETSTYTPWMSRLQGYMCSLIRLTCAGYWLWLIARRNHIFRFCKLGFSMATKAPLLGAEKKGGHSKASIFYGADEYLEDFA